MILWAATAAIVSGSQWPLLDSLADTLSTYLVLGASAIVTSELAPIFAGIAVHEGELRLERVLWAISLGGWIATTVLYAVGRAKWDWVRRRFPRTRATGTVALRVVGRRPLLASFVVRYAFGLRIVLPIACGAARVPWLVYLVSSLAGSVAWTLTYTLVGYVAGEAAVRMLGHLSRVGETTGAILVTALVFGLVWWQRRRQARKASRRARSGPAGGSAASFKGEPPRE